jgi:predicted alpha/beta hydrolase family esterase
MTFDQWAKGQMLLDDEIGLSYARRAWEAAIKEAARVARSHPVVLCGHSLTPGELRRCIAIAVEDIHAVTL